MGEGSSASCLEYYTKLWAESERVLRMNLTSSAHLMLYGHRRQKQRISTFSLQYKASNLANFLLSKLLRVSASLDASPQCLWGNPLDFTDPEIIVQGASAEVKWCGEMYAKKEFLGVNEDSFGKEAAILGKLTHPNVVRLLGYTSEPSTNMVTMLYESMEMDLKKQKMGMDPPFPLLAAVDIMLQLAKSSLPPPQPHHSP